MRYKVITQPSVEALTLDEARVHLRIEAYGSPLSHPDDNYISSMITVAREFCEQYLERSLAQATFELVLDDFPANEIELPMTPTLSVDSISYVSTDGSPTTVGVEIYTLDGYSQPNFIVLRNNQRWPQTNQSVNNVKIQFTAGYTNGASPDTYPLPTPIKAAMLLIIANLYENRQQDVLGNTRISFNSLPLGVYNLLQPYRLGLGL